METAQMPIGPEPRRKPGRRPWSTRSKGDDARRREDKKTEYFSFKMLPAMKDVVKDLAAEDAISLTRWVERSIIYAAKARGLVEFDRKRGVWIERSTGRALTQKQTT